MGYPPITTEMNEHGGFTIDPYQCELEAWRTVIRTAGFDFLGNYRQTGTKTIPFGSNWLQIREEVITDNESCLRCGMSRETHQEQSGRDLPVHHRIPCRRFYEDLD